MKEYLIGLIVAQSYHQILNWAKSLSDENRYASLEILRTLNLEEIMDEPRPKDYKEEYYQKYQLLGNIKNYMLICCIREAKDVSLTIPGDISDKSNSALHTYLRKPTFGITPLIACFKSFPPDYLDQVIEQNSKPRQWNNNFHLLWELYEHGWVTFNEEVFVRSLFIIPMFERDTMKDVQYLTEHPDVIDRVLLQFYKYEIPVLDISKWNEKSGFCCKKCTEYWDEVFSELLSQDAIKDRSIIRNLLSTLTYNWKQRHLDWHIRLLKKFNATPKEYLNNQDYLLAALLANSNSVCSFVINAVETLYEEDTFDAATFLQNLPNLLVKEKSDTAILKALDIVNYLLENDIGLLKNTDMISSALMQSNDLIQEKAALILKGLLNKDDLKMAVAPYAASLKQKARDILDVEQKKAEENNITALKNTPLVYPTTWEDLLFHVGKTINSLDAVDIDIMYNSFIELQDKIPSDYILQLNPFIKKVAKSDSDKELLVYISEFFESRISFDKKYKSNPEFVKHGINPNPFMRNRNKWVLDKLVRGSRLPLLSTPTHYPFYIHPEILVSKLNKYEKTGEPVEMEDLIIACNRILKTEISAKVKEQAEKLNGFYAGAIQYLLGISDQITFDKDTLSLWTQVARTKDANGIYQVFENSEAKDFPSVVNPFFISYIQMHNNMELDDKWNDPYARRKKKNPYPYPYFYTAYNSHESSSKAGFLYWLSLVPHYPDAVLLTELPWSSSDNEIRETEYCIFPLQYLVENQIQVHHSGWIYIASCLVFEKKVSRTLAAEYISIAFDLGFINKEYLAESIADMVTTLFTPVNRLIEYVDQVNPDHIKEFQLLILEKCIQKADKDNLPANFKKLPAAYKEINSSLKKEPKVEIEAILKTWKKR
ncbi:MAG: DUF6493 family protein [Tannerella sp.]|jgi:hypothetical protein|nr:DUF6493 family protein [Tannerella sp.]